MKKQTNQFAALPEEDRKHILNLCANNSYTRAAEILRKPRAEGGLNIITSRTALCRYFTNSQPDPELAVLAQFAAAANIRHEHHSNAFLGAIRAAIEARVFENLKSGKSLADMDRDFKYLRTIENLYLADAKWRSQNPKAARAAYKNHIQQCADAPEDDFIPADEATGGADPGLLIENLSDIEHDILESRKRKEQVLASLQASGIQRDQLPENFTDFNPTLLASIIKSRQTQAPPVVPPSPTPKTPVIPPIPGNSTYAVPPNPKSPAPEQTKPKPYIAPPKINRNDPCPCNSGRKAKKCCHR
jgi:hypothetical protein